MPSFLRRLALMLGNVVTGLSVLAPTAMLTDWRRSACRHQRHRPAGHLWRGGAVHRLAADRLAHRPCRPPPAAGKLARAGGDRAGGLGAGAELHRRAGRASADAGGRRRLYAAGGGDGRDDRAGARARQRHRLRLSRLDAGHRRRLAAGDAAGDAFRLAHGVRRARAVFGLRRAACCSPLCRPACRGGRCRWRALPPSSAAGAFCSFCCSRCCRPPASSPCSFIWRRC